MNLGVPLSGCWVLEQKLELQLFLCRYSVRAALVAVLAELEAQNN